MNILKIIHYEQTNDEDKCNKMNNLDQTHIVIQWLFLYSSTEFMYHMHEKKHYFNICTPFTLNKNEGMERNRMISGSNVKCLLEVLAT